MCLDPSDGVFGPLDLAALCGRSPHLKSLWLVLLLMLEADLPTSPDSKGAAVLVWERGLWSRFLQCC